MLWNLGNDPRWLLAKIGDFMMNAWQSSRIYQQIWSSTRIPAPNKGNRWLRAAVVRNVVRNVVITRHPPSPGTRRRSTCEPRSGKSCSFRRWSIRPWTKCSDSAVKNGLVGMDFSSMNLNDLVKVPSKKRLIDFFQSQWWLVKVLLGEVPIVTIDDSGLKREWSMVIGLLSVSCSGNHAFQVMEKMVLIDGSEWWETIRHIGFERFLPPQKWLPFMTSY